VLHPAERAFSDAVSAVMDSFAEEGQLSVHQMIGVLDVLRMDLCYRAMFAEEGVEEVGL